MNRRYILVGAVALVLMIAGAWVMKPIAGAYWWKIRSGVKELPIPGATIGYRDFGKGSPAIVIASGMSVHMESYYDMQRVLSKTTRVISYDRPGIGYSSYNKDPRTLDYIDRDMQAFLHKLGVPPPYILIGHSLGGHIVRYFAAHHPKQVAGLVLLDAPPADWPWYIRRTWSKKEVKDYFVWWNPPHTDPGRAELEERLAYEKNCKMIMGVKIPPDIPVLMFTGNNYGHFRKTDPGRTVDRDNWASMQAAELDGVKDATQLVNWNVGHMMYRDDPPWVDGKIEKFIYKVRAELAAKSNPVSLESPAPAPSKVAAAASP